MGFLGSLGGALAAPFKAAKALTPGLGGGLNPVKNLAGAGKALGAGVKAGHQATTGLAKAGHQATKTVTKRSFRGGRR